MMRYYFFVCILLTTLSVVNGIPLNKRATLFMPCNSTIPTLDITINPDPPIPGKTSTFKLKGNFEDYAVTGSLLGVLFVNPKTLDYVNDPNAKYVQNLCIIASCPVISLDIDVVVPIPKVGMPADIIVGVTDAYGTKIHACAVSVPIGSPALKFLKDKTFSE
ncbi:uncharacterized protein OCT59_001538 [Rhizophagus irregularis]|uniref:Phosphatidylglycerol/phosphatidylinositol transfer protein n=2 Tax=Rhizophagus irregularis (strain DAOM 181602 / DAOM 197198 / MUCL 43194) TaxID=747089 RepID=A0A2P4PV86_RHIID|nr:hypothetical protein GLOIN_2v1480129 [Rhizophagus irregularis DAOM 181602=DAOM 197198]POG69286.1 hypothetical protein GLOIN_2v1480129 [Rhizophagus irregularis DAOM 181602=DAOM 197198]UZO00286.1 hypothetical protein OCT59_001538 [Rhizophagus irregularis]GBC50482.2 hypothetical protein GLOIN_2v1480129 [Rhizophagus irregularis DAOM 181602=DAOM 197198]|eukprot:XP_025176152.1 hypothetical protein GLOIN_2v1480129 [Rhizophagus irregularis DAOM 181602=DAOM 197198]